MAKNFKKQKRKGFSKTFKNAVHSTPAIAGAYRAGIQALTREHRNGIRNGHIATGSIDLDAALLEQFPSDPRWDYGIGIPKDSNSEKVLWLEVHHAASGETERVLNKLEALKCWLREYSPALNTMEKVFVWQLSNVERNPNDRRNRNALAARYGLRRVQGVVDLAGFD